jgi:hypothetical protein
MKAPEYIGGFLFGFLSLWLVLSPTNHWYIHCLITNLCKGKFPFGWYYHQPAMVLSTPILLFPMVGVVTNHYIIITNEPLVYPLSNHQSMQGKIS